MASLPRLYLPLIKSIGHHKGDIMANLIDIPVRAGSLEYDEDTITDIAETLDDLPEGKAVVVDEAQDTEAKARTRAKLVRRILKDTHGLTVKTHAVVIDGEYVPAVSIPKKDR